MLVAMIVWQLKAKIIDVETAFLHGDLEEEIYMDIPEGLEYFDGDVDKLNECLLLLQTIYGLVQSARAFWKKLCKILIKIGFRRSQVDPCLLIRKNKKGLILLALYVDDCLAIGHEDALKTLIEEMKAHGLTLKVEEELSDYLSCEIRFNKDRTKAWLGQPHLIKNLEAKFGEMVSGLTTYKTPGTPNQGIVQPTEEQHKISPEDQSIYRSGVGMLLYLVKHSRPDIANVVRELSKCNDGATQGAFQGVNACDQVCTGHQDLRFED